MMDDLLWDGLSMREKAAYIRDAVSRGIYDIDNIRLEYNEFKKGGNTLNPPLKYIYDELPRLLREAGLDVKVSSGYRRAGVVGTAGNKSWHPRHGAVDIVPLGNTTFEDIEYTLHNNPVIRLYMLSNNFGLLDESGRTPESRATMLRTGATGPHFHIGKDSKPAAMYRLRVGALQQTDGNKVVYFNNPFLPLPEPKQTLEPTVVESLVIDNSIPSLIQELSQVIQEPIAFEGTIPEVVVTPNRPRYVIPDEEILSLMLGLIKPYTPIEVPKPLTTTERLKLLNDNRVTLLLKDLEDSIIRDNLLGTLDSNKLARDVYDLKFYRNMSANGGNLFQKGGKRQPTGGPLIEEYPGLRVWTEQCAEYSNKRLRDNGYLTSGNAWRLNHVDPIFNGYEGLERPENYILSDVVNYNHAATDNVYRNFDSKTLDINNPYIVNMYYNDSPSLEEAYNNGKGVTGTHTGLLTYDEPTLKWWVTHNIHGNIHQEPFIDLLNSKGKYGVTAIYAPRKNTIWNRVKGFFGFADGGNLLKGIWDLNTIRGEYNKFAKGGKKLEYHPEEDYYYGGVPFGITVTGQKKKNKPYWVSPRGAGNTALTAGDLSKAYTAATVGLLPNPISAGINLSQGKVLNALEDMWLYNSAHSEDPDVNYGVVGFSVPEGSLFSSVSKAAKATPEQWTAAQDAAIARGDMAEAQRLRDLHFKVSAPNTKIGNTMYHGTDETFNLFDRNKIGTKTDYGVFGEGFYFSPTTSYAIQYGDNVMPVYLNIENPYVGVDAGGILSSKYIPRDPEKAYQSAYEVMLRRGKSAEEASKIANKHKQNAIDLNRKAEEMRSKGYDGIFANTKQVNSNEHQFVAFNPEQIKSADAVTYDDNGVRIPLGLRDNFNMNDNRYGLLPFIGLGTLGTMYGASNQ